MFAILRPGVERVGGAVGAAESFALADEVEQVGLLLIAERQFAAGEEVDGVVVAQVVGVDQGDVFGVHDFEDAGRLRQILHHLDGGIDTCLMAKTVGGSQVEHPPRSAGCSLGGRERQDGHADKNPPASHAVHCTPR